MKDSFWWVWIKGLFNKPIPVEKEPTEIDRRVALYHAESRKRMNTAEDDLKAKLVEVLTVTYKDKFKKEAMFLVGHRPNPEYLNLLAFGFPELGKNQITDLFYEISAEAESITSAYLETPGNVDTPTPVYDKALADFNVRICFMGDIGYPIRPATYLIQRYGVWVPVRQEAQSA